MGEKMNESSQTAAAKKRGQAGWRRPRISYAAEERTGCCSRRHRCFRKIPTLYVQEGDREASSLEKKTTVLWPRRGRKELRQRCWSFFDGSYRTRTARTGYASCSSPGVFTPARSDGEHRTGTQDQDRAQGRRSSRGRATSPWPTAASESKTLPDAGEENTAQRSGRSPSTPTQGRLRGASRGFSLAVSTTRGGPRPSTSPHSHTHRRWGSIAGRGVATDWGSRGGSRIPITRGSIRGEYVLG